MTHFNFAGFQKHDEQQTSTTQPGRLDGNDDLGGTCDFMPQSTSPIMIMAAARPLHDSVLERQLRLLLPDRDNSHVEEDSDGEEYDHHGSAGKLYIDGSQKTPPCTPSTPTTDTWPTLTAPKSLMTSFMNISMYLRAHTPAVAIFIFVLLIAFVIILTPTVTVAKVRTATWLVAQVPWMALRTLSGGIEAIIEGTGWIIGRAIGRFGNGFEHGYKL